MTGAVPPRPTWGQRQEPHGREGSGGGPGTEWRDVQVSEDQKANELQEEKRCRERPGDWGQAFSPLARSREPETGGGVRLAVT